MAHFGNWRLILISVLLAVCCSTQIGLMNAILNVPRSVMQRFINVSNHDMFGFYIDEAQQTWLWSLFMALGNVGMILGTLTAPIICGIFGGRRVILLNGCPMCIGLLLQALAQRLEAWPLLAIGRLIWAIACGIIAIAVPVCLSDVAAPSLRARLIALHAASISLGLVLACAEGLPETLGTVSRWPYEYVTLLCMQVILCLILFLCPEPPKFLYMRRQNMEAAAKSLEFYQGVTTKDALESVFLQYDKEKSLGSQSRLPFKEAFLQKELRKPICIGAAAYSTIPLSGIVIMAAFSTEFFQNVGLSSHTAQYATLGLACVRFLTCFLGLHLVEKIGRRPLLMNAVWICFGALCACMTCYSVHHFYPDAAWVGYLFSGALLLCGLSVSCGIQVVAVIYPAELVPNNIKPLAYGVATLISWVLSILLAITFYPFEQVAGTWAWLELIVPLLCVALYLQLELPETKGRSVAEVLKVLALPKQRGKCLPCNGTDTCAYSSDSEHDDLKPVLKTAGYGSIDSSAL